MVDLRYHVFSLVAVLLALGIGILLGTTLVERGLIAEQKSQIKSLEKTFDEIKTKNEELHGDLGVYEEFATEAQPYLVSGRLVGRSIAVLSRSGVSGEGLGSITDAVSSAGGSVPLTITIEGLKAYQDPAVSSALAALFQIPAEPEALQARVITEVANQVVTASNPAMLTELNKLGVIRVSGVLPGPLSGAVILAEDEKVGPEVAQIDVPLIKAFTSLGFPTVGVGDAQTGIEVLDTYEKSGISTVERIDIVPGQVATVMALEGMGGHYGSSEDRLIPEPPGG